MFHPYEVARLRLIAAIEHMMLQDLTLNERQTLAKAIAVFKNREPEVQTTPQRAPKTKARGR